MKPNQLAIAMIGLAVLLTAGVVVYKVSHHGAKNAPAPASASRAPVAAATPVAPAEPAAPATTIKPVVKDALKAGLLNPIFYVQAKLGELHEGLVSALNSQRVKLDDLDKLDFGTAASAEPFSVFNPNGKVRYAPPDGLWLPQDLIDRLTTKKGTPLVFNMRRVTDKTGTSEVLYAVIPSISPANCGIAAGGKDCTSSVPIVVQNDPHTIIDEAPGVPVIDIGCLHGPDNEIVWLYKLKVRFKHKNGENRWGSR